MHATPIHGAALIVCLFCHLSMGAIDVLPAGGNAWHVTTAIDGDIIYACYDGHIIRRSADMSQTRWTYDTGAFPYDLVARDIDGDGKAETLVASADGYTYALDADGTLRWRFAGEGAMYAVAAANLAGTVRIATSGADGNLHLLDADGKLLRTVDPLDYPVANLAAGDVDGDGFEEVVALYRQGFGVGRIRVLRGDELAEVWQQIPTVRGGSARWVPYTVSTADLDGDGKVELLLGAAFRHRRAVRVVAGDDGRTLWERTPFTSRTYGTNYSIAQAVACDVTDDPGLEVVALNACRIVVYDAQGNDLGKSLSPLIAFADICPPDPATGEVLLASTPNGDDNIYRLRFDDDWPKELASLERHGLMAQVGENLARIREQVVAYDGRAPDNARYTVFISGGSPNTPELIRAHFGRFSFCREAFPYDNIDFVMTCMVFSDEGVPGFAEDSFFGSKALPPDDIPKLFAETYEADGIPFYGSIGHGCKPFITLDTAEAILKACPTTCRGFLVSENTRTDDRLAHFLDYYLYGLMTLCQKYDRKVIMVEKAAWWITIPAMQRFKPLFDGTYADVLVPSVEDSNSRCPELNLSGRAGLFVTGAVDEWSARTISDELCWSRMWEWEFPMSGHPFLRRQLAQALLGARMFEYTTDLYAPSASMPQWEPLAKPPHAYGNGPQLSTISDESFAIVTHMLGKGLLIPPKPGDMLNLAPMQIGMREPDAAFLDDAYALHSAGRFKPDRRGPFEGLAEFWGMTPTQSQYIGRCLMGVMRHYGGFVPATQYGMPLIVPAADRMRWQTDGMALYRDGELADVASLCTDFQAMALTLPVRVEGQVFAQVQRLDDGAKRITLVDNGFLDPADRPVTLHFQRGALPEQVVDILNGERLPMHERTVQCVVPAGAFRILEVR